MRYKRQEPFRYQFPTPIYCIIQADQEKIDGSIFDLSPNGMKITSTKDLPLFKTIHITFGLNGNQIKATGTVRWKKIYSSSWIVGLQLQQGLQDPNVITNELKKYVKKLSKARVL